MKVKYISPSNCRICMDSFPNEVGKLCHQCEVNRTHIVDLTSTGNGFFGNKATIFLKGKLELVHISCIFELDKDEFK